MCHCWANTYKDSSLPALFTSILTLLESGMWTMTLLLFEGLDEIKIYHFRIITLCDKFFVADKLLPVNLAINRQCKFSAMMTNKLCLDNDIHEHHELKYFLWRI